MSDNEIVDIESTELNHIKSENDEIKIKYKNPENKKTLEIFGSSFVYLNRENQCKIIYKEKEYKLTNILNIEKNNEEIEIILKGINNITNMNRMFYFTSLTSLQSLPHASIWNTSNVTNMREIFYGCSLLTSLPDISKWDTSNV